MSAQRATPVQQPAQDPAWPPLDDHLAEVEFFRGQGLCDDAEALLAELRERYPGHPGLADPDEASVDGPENDSLPEQHDREEDAYISGIFEDRKRAPSESVAAVSCADALDAQSAFDLGIAYLEMGLAEDAGEQFVDATADPLIRPRAEAMLRRLRSDAKPASTVETVASAPPTSAPRTTVGVAPPPKSAAPAVRPKKRTIIGMAPALPRLDTARGTAAGRAARGVVTKGPSPAARKAAPAKSAKRPAARPIAVKSAATPLSRRSLRGPRPEPRVPPPPTVRPPPGTTTAASAGHARPGASPRPASVPNTPAQAGLPGWAQAMIVDAMQRRATAPLASAAAPPSSAPQERPTSVITPDSPPAAVARTDATAIPAAQQPTVSELDYAVAERLHAVETPPSGLAANDTPSSEVLALAACHPPVSPHRRRSRAAVAVGVASVAVAWVAALGVGAWLAPGWMEARRVNAVLGEANVVTGAAELPSAHPEPEVEPEATPLPPPRPIVAAVSGTVVAPPPSAAEHDSLGPPEEDEPLPASLTAEAGADASAASAAPGKGRPRLRARRSRPRRNRRGESSNVPQPQPGPQPRPHRAKPVPQPPPAAGELLARSKSALARGDASGAYQLARRSYRARPGPAAAEVMALAACRNADDEAAKAATRKLPLAVRSRVRRKCRRG